MTYNTWPKLKVAIFNRVATSTKASAGSDNAHPIEASLATPIQPIEMKTFMSKLASLDALDVTFFPEYRTLISKLKAMFAPNGMHATLIKPHSLHPIVEIVLCTVDTIYKPEWLNFRADALDSEQCDEEAPEESVKAMLFPSESEDAFDEDAMLKAVTLRGVIVFCLLQEVFWTTQLSSR